MNYKLDKLYELVLTDKEITGKELKKIGFTKQEIKLLIENNILEKIKIKRILDIFKDRNYLFKDIDGLISYVKKTPTNDFKAINYYEKVLEYKKDKDILIRLLLLYIKNNDYLEGLKIFLNTYEIKDYDYNFYLYLFSQVVKLDNEHLEEVKKIRYRQVEITNINIDIDTLDILNNIRLSILNHHYSEARNLLERVEDSVSKEIILTFLEQIINKENINKKIDLTLIKNKQYLKLLNILEGRSIERELNKVEKYEVILIKEYFNIKNNHIVEDVIKKQSDNVFMAIDNKDYKMALRLTENYCRERGYIRSENALFLILRDIVSEIEIIEKIEEIDICDIELEELPSLDNIKEDIRKDSLFKEIINLLGSNSLELDISLREWLLLIGKMEYEVLIHDLIEIIRLEESNDFDEIKDILTKIKDNNYCYKLGEYILKFYQEINNSNYHKARVYLDIIRNSEKLGQQCNLVGVMESILEDDSNKKSKKRLKKTLDYVKNSL